MLRPLTRNTHKRISTRILQSQIHRKDYYHLIDLSHTDFEKMTSLSNPLIDLASRQDEPVGALSEAVTAVASRIRSAIPLIHLEPNQGPTVTTRM